MSYPHRLPITSSLIVGFACAVLTASCEVSNSYSALTDFSSLPNKVLTSPWKVDEGFAPNLGRSVNELKIIPFANLSFENFTDVGNVYVADAGVHASLVIPQLSYRRIFALKTAASEEGAGTKSDLIKDIKVKEFERLLDVYDFNLTLPLSVGNGLIQVHVTAGLSGIKFAKAEDAVGYEDKISAYLSTTSTGDSSYVKTLTKIKEWTFKKLKFNDLIFSFSTGGKLDIPFDDDGALRIIAAVDYFLARGYAEDNSFAFKLGIVWQSGFDDEEGRFAVSAGAGTSISYDNLKYIVDNIQTEADFKNFAERFKNVGAGVKVSYVASETFKVGLGVEYLYNLLAENDSRSCSHKLNATLSIKISL